MKHEHNQSATGVCLCGAVTITFSRLSAHVGACHCSMCRKWNSAPMMAVDGGSEILVSGEESVTEYSSSPWATRGFCKHCGTHLFYHLLQPSLYVASAGLFPDTEFVFDHQIFIEEKPSYYSFEQETVNKTGKEVFSEFSEK